jgi:Na+-transporting NADH:ubiquinone oxidoreductase subunit NqrB
MRLPAALADARTWQILSLATLLAYGLFRLNFDQAVLSVGLVIVAALATEWAGRRLVDGKPFDPLSPLITALSLSLLLRAASPGWLASAAVLAIGAKFVLRIDGKHVFNPANFGIGVLVVFTDAAWVSPSQWGSTTWAVFLFTSLAILVLSRARRSDIALAFLGSYAAILLVRAIYLGDPLAIPLKQLQSGALLLFAFFMITDPKTTPDRRDARILYAVLVAAFAAWLQFWHWIAHGLILALFFLSPLVPVLDRLMPRRPSAPRFEWWRPVVN